MSAGEGRGGDRAPPIAIPPGLVSTPHQPSHGTCARRHRGAPTCHAGAPADSVCPLRRDGGGGVGASRLPGVGLRRQVSPGTHGLWEPGTRKRREAEVGEGRQRAHALASRPAAGGEPLWERQLILPRRPKSSQPASFLPAPSPPAPHSARRRRWHAQFRTHSSTSRTPPRAQSHCGGYAQGPGPLTLAAPGLPDSPTATSTHQHPDTLTHGCAHISERAHAGEKRLGTCQRKRRAPTRGCLSRQVHCGGGPPDPGTHKAASGSRPRYWREPPPRLSCALGGVGTGRGGSGLEGWAAAPHPQTTPAGC